MHATQMDAFVPQSPIGIYPDTTETQPAIQSLMVPVGEFTLLVGTQRQVLLLNPAARRQAENGELDIPSTFLKPTTSKVITLTPATGKFAPMEQRTVRLFNRTVTIEYPASSDVESALFPWRLCSRKSNGNSGTCDLTIQRFHSGYIGKSKFGAIELLHDWTALTIWLSREISSLIHEYVDWFATFHAGGVVYNDKLIAFPGSTHSGKSTLMASLCMAGHGYFGEDCLPILDTTLMTAAFPLAIKLRKPSWPLLRDLLPDFDKLLEGKEAGVPVKFWQPPVHATQRLPIKALVFPHYKQNSSPEWKKLDLIETVFELLASDSGPVESTPESWRKLIAALETIPAFEIRYGSMEDSHRLVEVVASHCS